MSSTGRGGDREELDGYYTPIRCAEAIVQRLKEDGWAKPGCTVLEPSIGKGAFAAAASVLLEPELLEGVDLLRRDDLAAVLDIDIFEQDFLDFEPTENGQPFKYDLIVGNPPYSGAEEHIRRALKLLAPGGVLAFLLRLNFLGGVERRRGLYQETPFRGIYQLDRRPSFMKKRKHKRDPKTGELLYNKNGTPKMVTVSNDATEYAVFLWQTPETREILGDPFVRFMTWKPDRRRRQGKRMPEGGEHGGKEEGQEQEEEAGLSGTNCS